LVEKRGKRTGRVGPALEKKSRRVKAVRNFGG